MLDDMHRDVRNSACKVISAFLEHGMCSAYSCQQFLNYIFKEIYLDVLSNLKSLPFKKLILDLDCSHGPYADALKSLLRRGNDYMINQF